MTENKSLAPAVDWSGIEKVLIKGDLSSLNEEQKIKYYQQMCASVGLNALSRPFEYLTLNNKLVLYARKDATDQLRKLYGVSIAPPTTQVVDGLCIVTVHARTFDGREDSDIGVVTVDNLKGDARANAIMKAHTKAKRRVTLSICGLGMLDETEIETIPNAQQSLPAAGAAVVTVQPRQLEPPAQLTAALDLLTQIRAETSRLYPSDAEHQKELYQVFSGGRSSADTAPAELPGILEGLKKLTTRDQARQLLLRARKVAEIRTHLNGLTLPALMYQDVMGALLDGHALDPHTRTIQELNAAWERASKLKTLDDAERFLQPEDDWLADVPQSVLADEAAVRA
jgi:hypothetical protein